jgi:transglutaminase-like putative cysteine protease
MYYSIRHVTKYRYSEHVSESVMEVHMQPRTEDSQRCLSFELRTTPKALITSYVDDLGNRLHYFDVPDRHTHLAMRAEALVEITIAPTLPEALDSHAWFELDAMTAADDYWDFLMPSHFACATDLLLDLARELRVERRVDPLTMLRELNTAIHDAFEYDPQSTEVDSPIDDALGSRRGVCQDFAHIMIALVRRLGIPCRYVSGYLFHRMEDHDRSAQDATHAWVEALLPDLGWIGFDPTNNLLARDRHIRVAKGRDYADVPPTHGLFKGTAKAELAVAVQVSRSDAPPMERPDMEEPEPSYHQSGQLDPLPDQELQEQPQQ